MENKADSSTILHDLLEKVAPKLSSSKTLRESSLPTRDEISQQSFGRWPTSGMAWRGECLTVDTSASPSHAQGSSFADLMETQKPPQEYFLSQNAAIGILRRVDRMGRHLLPPLRKSLEILSGATPRNSPTAYMQRGQDTQEPIGAETMSHTLKAEK